MKADIAALLYLASGVLFILALKGLSSPATSQTGNRNGMIGMGLAIATTLWVVYPPGIATIVPGERLSERARPMLDYLRVFQQGANRFPGFEAELQGVYREIQDDGSVRFYTYVVKE